MNMTRKNRKAFSLIEICIVCGVLIIFLVPVLTLLSRSSSGTIRNRNEILAQQHASNVIAFCNALKYDDDFLKPTDNKVPENLKINAGDHVIDLNLEENSIFSRTISIKEFKDGDWPFHYKTITVTVQWQQPGEKEKRKLQMTGLVADR